jgi:hypothetical protein
MNWKPFPETKPTKEGWHEIVLENGIVTCGFWYKDRFIFSSREYNHRTHEVAQFNNNKIRGEK